jgi:hypothetical protein
MDTEDVKEVRGRVPPKMQQMYRFVLSQGYSPSEVAREGIRAMYRKLTTQEIEVKAWNGLNLNQDVNFLTNVDMCWYK